MASRRARGTACGRWWRGSPPRGRAAACGGRAAGGERPRAAARGAAPRRRVFVATIPSTEQVGVFMGPGAGQVSFMEAKPESKGLIDDVVLESQPRNTFVSDVYVQP